MSPDESRRATERQAALDDHQHPRPAKPEIRAAEPVATGIDLSRADSPGVVDACPQIGRNAADAFRFTANGNLVAVIANGTAMSGGIGAQASRPVMEGKAVLSGKFAGMGCFDIGRNASDPATLAEIVCALESTFGVVAKASSRRSWAGRSRAMAEAGQDMKDIIRLPGG